MESDWSVREFLGSSLRITINNNAPLINRNDTEPVSVDELQNCTRIVEGTLLAIDNDPNILLDEVEEQIFNSLTNALLSKRALGLVSIPCLSIAKIQVSKREFNLIKKPNLKSKIKNPL